MDNKQRELEASNPQSNEIAVLEEQLAEAVAADNFFETATGKLFQKLATAEITRIVNDVTSDKYRKDLVGYNLAIADLNAYKKLLRKMQVAGSPARMAKIRERLDGGEQ